MDDLIMLLGFFNCACVLPNSNLEIKKFKAGKVLSPFKIGHPCIHCKTPLGTCQPILLYLAPRLVNKMALNLACLYYD